MFKCATTWLRPPSGSVISPCNNARRDYLRRRWWRASSSGDCSSSVEMEGGRDHEWKGWEVVSLSTHTDGYLSRLINDAYVDRLWSLLVVRGKRNSLPRRLLRSVAVFRIGLFIRGSYRVCGLSKNSGVVVFYRLTTLIVRSLHLEFLWHRNSRKAINNCVSLLYR